MLSMTRRANVATSTAQRIGQQPHEQLVCRVQVAAGQRFVGQLISDR
jgi:hypothetical protein